MQKKLTSIVKVMVFFGVGLIILFLVYQRQDVAYQLDCQTKGIAASDCSLIKKVIEDITNANYFWVVLTMGLFMLTNVLRALRWKMMFVAIGYKPRFINLFGTIMINYLANLGIPRSGEIIRAGLISRYEDIPIEKALGTIFTDRIFDVIMLALVIGLAMIFGGSDFLSYLNENINLGAKLSVIYRNQVLLSAIIIIGFLLTYCLWKYKNRIANTKMGQKLLNLFIGFSDGVQSVKNVSSISLFAFYTIGIWILYYFMMYLAFFSFEPTSVLGPTEGLVVFVFGSLGILIPTPGGMGSYHFLVGEALAMYGINGTDAFSFANIVFFSIQIFVNIVFGLLALIVLPIINKE
jgi:hypothetical protein